MFKLSIIKKLILIGFFLVVLIIIYVSLFNIAYSLSTYAIILDNEVGRVETKIDSIKVLVTGIWLDATDKNIENASLETVVTLTNLTNGKKYNGILKSSDTLIFKGITYGTYKITCENPLDINYVQSNLTNDEFTLEEYGEKTKEISITNQLAKKSGFYNIKEANNLMKYTEILINDTIPPVISEVTNIPKTFYITQSNNVDLSSYVTALDDIDGDITDKIVISSSPEFDKNTPRTYEITYNVKDNSNNAATPLKIKIIIWNFVKIESGNYHTLALTSHGRLWSWGYNAEGQIGKGSSGNAPTPVLLNLTDVIDITANEYSSYAVTKDGQIYSWGYAGTGRLGDGTTVNRNYPSLVTMPENTKFVKVSAEYESVAALTDTGEVYVWGGNGSGRLGLGTTTTATKPMKLTNLSNIVEISQGGLAGAAIDNDGILYTWGSDATYNLLGDAANSGSQKLPGTYSGLTDMKYVELGRYHAIAISNSGQVYTWGDGANGKLGNAGTSNSSTPYTTSISNAEQASANLYHSLVKTSDGKLYVFGQNIYGKLGLGDSATRNVPILNNNAVFISNGTGNVKWVSTMLDSSVILTEDTIAKNNTVYGMGYNGSYQFGSGTIGDSNIPKIWTFTPSEFE